MLIDIEGTDGSGKFTQTKLLYECLMEKGHKCLLQSFPNYDSLSSGPVKMYLNGDIGENANCLNGYQTSTLFAADRLITMSRNNYADYEYVLLDRYTPSNMIHQSTRISDENELDSFLDWVEEFEYGSLKLPKPDVTIFLDVPIEVSSKLAKNREKLKNGQDTDILERDIEHLKTAYKRAKFVAEKYHWLRIDCVNEAGEMKDVDTIHQEIKRALKLI